MAVTAHRGGVPTDGHESLDGPRRRLRVGVVAPVLAEAAVAVLRAGEEVKRVATTYAKADGKLTPSQTLIVDYAKDAKHPIPAGGLFSTGEDLAKLYCCLLRKTQIGDKRILSRKSFIEMTHTQTGDLKTGFVEGMSFGYGFAVVVEPKGVTAMLSPGTFGHGGAYGTQSWADPKQDLFVVLLIQRTGLSNGDASEMRQEFQRLAVDGANAGQLRGADKPPHRDGGCRLAMAASRLEPAIQRASK